MTTLIKAMNDVHTNDDNNNKNIYSNIMMIYTISWCWLPATALVSKCVVRTEDLNYLLLNAKLALNVGIPQARISASTK